MRCDVCKGCTEAESSVHPGHISPYLRQHKHTTSVIRGGTDLSFSYLCTQILSLPSFVLFLSLSLCVSLSSPNRRILPAELVIHSGASWDVHVHVLAYLHEQSGSPLHGWKNERLTAGQPAPYASCVCVNRSETVTLPSSETEAYISGVSKRSHGGMNK